MDADSEEGILHGIIVASSRVSNMSYLVPASNIVEEIKANWGEEIESADQILPLEGTEISTLHLQAGIPFTL